MKNVTNVLPRQTISDLFLESGEFDLHDSHLAAARLWGNPHIAVSGSLWGTIHENLRVKGTVPWDTKQHEINTVGYCD
jgi:hypothetical protein